MRHRRQWWTDSVDDTETLAPENAWIGQRMVKPGIDHATTAKSFGAWSAGPIIDPADLPGVFRQAIAEVEKGGVAVVDVHTKLT